MIPGLTAVQNIALMLPGRARPDIPETLAQLTLGAEAASPASGPDEEARGLVTALIAGQRARARFALVVISHDRKRRFTPVSRSDGRRRAGRGLKRITFRASDQFRHNLPQTEQFFT